MGESRSSQISTWLVRMATWDGMLPALVWCAPVLVKQVLPNIRGAIEITALILPTMGFLVRYIVGTRRIQANRCGAGARRFQVVLLCVGIFTLALVGLALVTGVKLAIPQVQLAGLWKMTIFVPALWTYLLLQMGIDVAIPRTVTVQRDSIRVGDRRYKVDEIHVIRLVIFNTEPKQTCALRTVCRTMISCTIRQWH